LERPDTSSDCALMLRARRNDVDAFECLYERHHARLQHFFHALCARSRGAGPAQTAEDLCHETFLRIWRLRMRYRVTGTFAAYLFGVARNVWREHCRRAGA
jgi:RNA polymerase sigma-70 factor (ECF subfamily)